MGGLTLANDLASRGSPFRVIDLLPEPVRESRARLRCPYTVGPRQTRAGRAYARRCKTTTTRLSRIFRWHVGRGMRHGDGVSRPIPDHVDDFSATGSASAGGRTHRAGPPRRVVNGIDIVSDGRKRRSSYGRSRWEQRTQSVPDGSPAATEARVWSAERSASTLLAKRQGCVFYSASAISIGSSLATSGG